MGKQKKRKTQNLSDAEIWDDSALIRSWDEAVEEYEYYHSIHARGEDVEEVLRQAELETKANSKVSVGTNGNHATNRVAASQHEDCEDGEIEDEVLEESTAPVENELAPNLGSKGTVGLPSLTNGVPGDANGSHSHSQAQGSNQVLENIKMAYWWAGYYSGLYESQQHLVGSHLTATREQQQT